MPKVNSGFLTENLRVEDGNEMQVTGAAAAAGKNNVAAAVVAADTAVAVVGGRGGVDPEWRRE